ncbi:hypothetical protein SEA_NICHOLAS_98 [Mycobacterium phage Nicholas]|uniref:Uncharacterized protein n=3 Tax=Lumosvirus TaxID=2948808 RepID=A0A0K2FN28_9CAUD|nr:hypothetical protein AVU96_gp081 [Mycobacterium phage Snenia]YP_009202485.1 hypothetical protein AVU99_gp081 [Mycobacterium phage Lolly9]YP_010012557.1 hypothetical protein J4T93_gp079 [Mycobacterium phage Lumos]YP_010012688.1 hypothetical protein J4T94_gp079 [Mycobacterium phage Krypton555]ASM62836.1 hypothetical protein SEA_CLAUTASTROPHE_99 [Mycobacterium phage Clautastrophe]ASR87026.1 hypothetical protein SEA_KINGSOLOMON_98 [Mycobacterium phage Kingsolomon]ASR87369.1 hypothetical protei
MTEVYKSDVECRCLSCDDMIRLGDEVQELSGELFHAECI